MGHLDIQLLLTLYCTYNPAQMLGLVILSLSAHQVAFVLFIHFLSTKKNIILSDFPKHCNFIVTIKSFVYDNPVGKIWYYDGANLQRGLMICTDPLKTCFFCWKQIFVVVEGNALEQMLTGYIVHLITNKGEPKAADLMAPCALKI